MSAIFSVVEFIWDALLDAIGIKYGWKAYALALFFSFVLIALVIGSMLLLLD